MKKSVLINLICSMLVTVVLIIGVLLVLVFTGKLDTQKQKLVISSASHTVTYDGKTLTDSRWSLIEGELKENHKLSVSVTGSQTSVGMSENYISAIIQDENGEDVTKEYSIEYRPGALQVKARELTLLAESAMKLYDGQPLTCNSYMLQSSVALLPTDELHVTVEGSITEIGEAVNQITSATVTSKATGEDMTRNYTIHSKSGKLVIYDENALVLKSKPDSKVYDGTPLTCPEYTVINGELKPGHTIQATNFASITQCGNTPNTFDVKIVDEAGNDVTKMYQIYTDCGTLSVTQAQLNLTGLDYTGTYGTTPLNAGNLPLEDVLDMDALQAQLPEGHTLVQRTDEYGNPLGISGEVPAFWGSENEENSIPITIDPSQFQVLDAAGNDVTDNFLLSVGNNGTPGGVGNSGSMTIEPPTGTYSYFEIMPRKLSNTNRLYLKQRSYGDYDLTTKNWKNAPDYSMSGDISSSYYFARSAFLAGGLTDSLTDRVEINPIGGIFALPYYSTAEQFIQTSDHTVVGNAAQGSYEVNYFSSNLSSGQHVQNSLSSLEAQYYSFVQNNYLTVDAETAAFLLQYAEENGLNPNSATIVSDVAAFLQNYWLSGLMYNMEYDREMDRADDPTVAFLRDYKQGVCRHYAQAATLLYRTLGIPARYTVGFVCDDMELGQTATVTDKDAHAWVEVYLEGTGWVYVEVTGGSNDSGNNDGDNDGGSTRTWKLKVSPVNKTAKYGTVSALYATALNVTDDGTWVSLESIGYTMEATYSAPATLPGMTESYVTSLKIFDGNGNLIYTDADGYGSADGGTCQWDKGNIEVEYKTGNLKLYRNKILLTTYSFSRTYGDAQWRNRNGAVYSFAELQTLGIGYSVTIDGASYDGVTYPADWISGYRIEIRFTGSNAVNALHAKVGSVKNAYTLKIFNADGIEVTTSEFQFGTEEEGSLSVEARVIGITAGSMSMTYTGEALTYDEATASIKTQVTSGTFAFDDHIDWSTLVITHKEAIAPGDYATIINTGVLKVVDGEGNDVTDCYTIETTPGVFTVNRPPDTP